MPARKCPSATALLPFILYLLRTCAILGSPEPFQDKHAAGHRSRSLLQSDQTCTVALEYSVIDATSSNFLSSLAVNDLSQDPIASWQLSWAYSNATEASTVHVDNVTGATLVSQSQSDVQLSSSVNSALGRHAPASVSISGYFDPALSGPVPAGLSLLGLQDVTLNGQTCSLTGVQSLNASSPSPLPGSPPQDTPGLCLSSSRNASNTGNALQSHACRQIYCCPYGAMAAASVSPAPAPAIAQSPGAEVRQASGAIPAPLAPATAPALGPGQAVTAASPTSVAPAAAVLAQASGAGSAPAHIPAVVIAAPAAGGAVLVLLLATVALARAGWARKARQIAPGSSRGDCSPGQPGMHQPLGHSTTPALFSDVSMALPKMPIRVPRHLAMELTAQGGSGRVLHGAVLPTHSSPAQTPLSVPDLLPALQIPRPAPANLLQPKPLTRRWTWQEGSVMSLLPGFASGTEAPTWQPSSAHSPASSASTTMTPNPWQGAYHEAAALARTQPAALQTPFQQVMHRTGSLQVEAVKEVDSFSEEEAAEEEGALPHLKGIGLMGQISLQALLDQSTAPPGFYTGGSRDMPAPQDLGRAKSTSYQGVTDIDWRDVVLETKIGAGAFGNVYKATWKGRAVAVKVMLASHGEHASELESFRQEVQVLSGLQHERIICLLGACLAPPHICIVEELANAGSLFSHLHGVKPGPSPTRGMPYAQLLQVALDVADALRYLHHHSYPQILHRDLKSSNVLLSRSGRAKVCDFGIAKFKDRTFVSTKHASAGTPAYMAPEMFEGKRISEKIDVFSFGILLWEMLTGQLPWGELSSPMQVIYVVGVLKRRLAIPRHSPQMLRTLIPACWEDDPDLRPTFQTVFPLLQTVLPPQRPFETEEYILDKEKLDTLLNMQEELDKVRAIAAS